MLGSCSRHSPSILTTVAPSPLPWTLLPFFTTRRQLGLKCCWQGLSNTIMHLADVAQALVECLPALVVNRALCTQKVDVDSLCSSALAVCSVLCLPHQGYLLGQLNKDNHRCSTEVQTLGAECVAGVRLCRVLLTCDMQQGRRGISDM